MVKILNGSLVRKPCLQGTLTQKYQLVGLTTAGSNQIKGDLGAILIF
jgi:hypothetical protein